MSFGILKYIRELKNMLPVAGPNPPATGTAVEKNLVACQGTFEGVLEGWASGFSDPVGPIYEGVFTDDPFWDAEILNNDGIVTTPVHHLRIQSEIPLGLAVYKLSSRAIFLEALMVSTACNWIRIIGIKFAPNLAFGVGWQPNNKKVCLVAGEKA
jgi:hypothetical protein